MYMCTKFAENLFINKGDAILVISKLATLICIIYAGPKIMDNISARPGPTYMSTKFDKRTIINKGGDTIVAIFKLRP